MAHALENSIREKESRIRKLLEDTGIISDIEFHAHSFFSLKFCVYNNARAREIIADCYKETYQRLSQQVKHITIYDESQDGEVKCRVDIDPTKKGAGPQIIDSILTYLAQDLERYMQRHQAEIRAYQRTIQKRAKTWD